MNFEVNNFIILDNSEEFLVLAKIEHQNNFFVYLINTQIKTNIIFCKIENKELIKVTDTYLSAILLEKANILMKETM